MNGNDLKKRFKQLVTWSVLIALVLCHNPQTMKTVLAIESETLEHETLEHETLENETLEHETLENETKTEVFLENTSIVTPVMVGDEQQSRLKTGEGTSTEGAEQYYYEIICNPNGGKFEEFEDSQQKTMIVPLQEKKVEITVLPPKVKRDGFIFQEWTGGFSGVTVSSNSNGLTTITSSPDIWYENTCTLELEAQWEKINYTINVEYELEEDESILGSGNAIQLNVEYGQTSAVVTLAEASKEGYFFTGWQLKDNSTLYSAGEQTLIWSWDSLSWTTNNKNYVATLSLIPQFKKINYTINVDYELKEDESILGSGNAIQLNVEYGQTSAVVTLAEASKEGYFFTGWQLEDNLNIYSAGTQIFEWNWDSLQWDENNSTTLELYPMFAKAKSITVVYDYGYEVESISKTQSQQTQNEESWTLFLPMPADRIGYNFVGWLYNEMMYEGEEAVELKYTEYDGKTVTFTAQWEEIYTINIEYVLNEDESILNSENPIKLNVKYGQESDKVMLVEPEKKGYFFTGWQLADNSNTYSAGEQILTWNWDNLKWNENNSTTLYLFPKFEKAKSITVVYDYGYDDLTATEIATQQNIEEESFAFCYLYPLVRNGYKFIGWLYNGKVYQSEEEIVIPYAEEDIEVTITAQWEKKKYILNLECMLGEDESLPDSDNLIQIEVEYQQESVIITLPKAVRKGYFCVGWELGDNQYSVGEQTFTGIWNMVEWNENNFATLELYPVFEQAKSINIIYDYGYENKTKTVLIKQEDFNVQDCTFPLLEAPTREGYQFLGWEITKETNAAQTQLTFLETTQTTTEPKKTFPTLQLSVPQPQTIDLQIVKESNKLYQAGDIYETTFDIKEITFTAIWEKGYGSGTFSLSPGTPYNLATGTWKVNNDETVYQGNITFYVPSEGEYTFSEN